MLSAKPSPRNSIAVHVAALHALTDTPANTCSLPKPFTPHHTIHYSNPLPDQLTTPVFKPTDSVVVTTAPCRRVLPRKPSHLVSLGNTSLNYAEARGAPTLASTHFSHLQAMASARDSRVADGLIKPLRRAKRAVEVDLSLLEEAEKLKMELEEEKVERERREKEELEAAERDAAIEELEAAIAAANESRDASGLSKPIKRAKKVRGLHSVFRHVLCSCRAIPASHACIRLSTLI